MTITGNAHRTNTRYAANTMANKSDVTPAERETLRARLRAGDWLRVGDVAKVLGIGRTKAHTLMTKGVIGYKLEAGGKYRQANPADVLKMLSESETEYRTTSAMDTASPQGPSDL
ncbi:hypothetical protein [Actinoplanes sp. NPDC051494]|uniref:hypothetical protein n=1 Tax=Actinoplanes sp. NPDC051494 TaxID=3363907 RepID=UPI0037BDA859